jgi:D-alanyl-D-alanine carboxypeptidase (penicillin-binding protein 5/6)
MKALFVLFFSLLLSPGAQAALASGPGNGLFSPAGRASNVAMPMPPVLEARAYLLYDVTSNQILVNQNGNTRMEPASLTKLMTAYVAFSAVRQKTLSLTKEVTPSADAVVPQGEESRMFLEATRPVTVAELLRGLIVQSGNDAARVLAETISGTEAGFAARMNQEAQRLGMKNTHFVNATGLPAAQHYSSAYDLSMLAAAIVRDYPEHFAIYSQREFQYNGINQFNRNRLLWMDPFVDGMKTGHTQSAGFCLVATAKREGRRLISVVLGTDSDAARAIESQKLLNHGFQNFEAVRLFKKDQSVAQLRVWKGTEKMLSAGFRQDMFVSIPRGQHGQLRAGLETVKPMIAPVSAGQRVGTLKLTLGGKPYFDYPLIAQESVPMANVFSRGWDTLRLFFQ